MDEPANRPKINLEAPPDEKALIARITERIVLMARERKVYMDVVQTAMDITNAHMNGCPLNLHQLLMAGDMDFAADIIGIGKSVDRMNGGLRNFEPRFSLANTRRRG